MRGFRPCLVVAALTVGACGQGADQDFSGSGPLIARTAPTQTTNAALSVGRFSLRERCLVFTTSDGQVHLPVFGYPVTLSRQDSPAPGSGQVLVLDEVYSVGGSLYPGVRAPRDVPAHILSQCPFPAFMVGTLRRGDTPDPPPPLG